MQIASAVPRRRPHGRPVLVCMALLWACSEGPGNPGPVATQLALAVVPATVAVNGAALAPQPVVQLQDDAGAAVALAGRLVTAVLSPPGASLGGTTEVRTDGQGRAAFTDLRITGTAGLRTLRFESTGLRTVVAPTIELTAGAASAFEAAGGNLQTATAGTAVATAPLTRVSDASGNPIAGAAVTFTVTGGGGSVEGGSTVTDASGQARPTRWVLGNEVGLNTLTATTPAVPGASVVFTATGVLGPPAELQLIAGNGQTATVGGEVAIAPKVKLLDALGHPLPNVAVTFTVTTGAGSLTLPTPLTDASGIATLGAWALGLVPGANSITASRAGVPSIVFTATGVDYQLAAIAAGGQHTCGLDAGGAALCWGSDQFGQLGNGAPQADTTKPAQVSGGLVFTSITSGYFHSCGLVGGAAWCWGGNSLGQLGDGTTTDRTAPVPVAGGHTFIALDAGDQFTCGLLASGLAYCWGRNATGQVGDGTTTNRSLPTPVSNGHVFNAIDAGSVHACGREASGSLWCWGSNGMGRLGDGTTVNSSIPVAVTGGHNWGGFAAGDSFTCGFTTAGAGYCWGNGAGGFLGSGNNTSQSNPTPISGTLVLSMVSTTGSHTCAITTQNQGYCWGFGILGQLGDGTFTARNVPTAIAGGALLGAISAGIEHTCALSTAGSSYCWGRNTEGRLGDGTTVGRGRPVGVVRP